MGSENKRYILHIVPKLEMGGIGMMLLNYYKNMDRDKYCFDIVVHGNEKGSLEDEFIKLGSRIFHITPKKESLKKYKSDLKRIYKSKNYYAIHAHQNTLSFFPLKIAKKFGYKIRIAHAHECLNSPTVIQKCKRNIFSILNLFYATNYLYCGENSKKWVYGNFRGKKFKFIPNGINLDYFSFSNTNRINLRNNFGVDDNTTVLITISRLSEEKNLKFVVDIVKKMKSQGNKLKYFIIGNGPQKDELSGYVSKNELKDEIVFLGEQKECAKFYSFADVYLLPSHFEAFPVGAIEAQANNCPSILSINVPKEVIMNSNVQRIGIDKENIDDWADTINSTKMSRNIVASTELKKFDIKYLAKQLEMFYDSLELR